jgi:hypothetical protein
MLITVQILRLTKGLLGRDDPRNSVKFALSPVKKPLISQGLSERFYIPVIRQILYMGFEGLSREFDLEAVEGNRHWASSGVRQKRDPE